MDEAKHETKCPDGKQKRIVLVGGGHAHVQVIKGLHHRLKPEDVDVILIDCNVTAFYSGMMPACVAGIYEGAETNIELVPLAKWARIQFIHARAVAINAGSSRQGLRPRADMVVFSQSMCQQTAK